MTISLKGAHSVIDRRGDEGMKKEHGFVGMRDGKSKIFENKTG